MDRRLFIKGTLGLGAGVGLGLPLFKPAHSAQNNGKKFLQIFLDGGWDSALATDPVVGDKANSGAYSASYNARSTFTVDGKANLKVGAGLEPMLTAMAAVPTAFVNGMFVEVTAHDLAKDYLHSGVVSLSRTRRPTAYVARIGEASKAYPPHVVIGGGISLGKTAFSAPPIHAGSSGSLADMMEGPYVDWIKADYVDKAHQLTKSLDDLRYTKTSQDLQISEAPWNNAQVGIEQLYKGNFGKSLLLTDEIKSNYGIESGSEDWRGASLVASAYLALKSGLSNVITVNTPGFDTHSNHFATHLPMMEDVFFAVNRLIADLQNTKDPHDSSRSLMETTTILITSEFVRTPQLNAGRGTDHWQSASAILMGQGVNDNTVIGATGPDAKALGWNGASVTFSESSALRPEHMISRICTYLGFSEIAQEFSDAPVSDLLS